MDLTDLFVIPMICVGIATFGLVIYHVTGWNIVLACVLGFVPGYALGVVVGLLLAFILGTVLEFVIKIGNWLTK